jgi:hypothetical protein
MCVVAGCIDLWQKHIRQLNLFGIKHISLLTLDAGVDGPPSQVLDVVDIFNGITGTWSTAVLSVARTALAATSLPNHGLAIFAGGTGVGTLYYIEF